MTVEAIIVLGIAAVCCILLTNRLNLIGPVLLIAAGAGASFIPARPRPPSPPRSS